MTADSMDLEDCDNLFKGVVDSLFTGSGYEDLDVNLFLNPPFRKPLPFTDLGNDSFLDPKYYSKYFNYEPFDLSNVKIECDDDVEWGTPPPLEPQADYVDYKRSSDSDMPTFEGSSHLGMDPDFILVSPNSVLPSAEKDDIEAAESVESIWPELSGLNDEKLIKMVDSVCLGDNYISIDDIFMKKKQRKFTHLDFDHCYSQRLPVDDYEEDEDDEDDFFNSSPYSPASSSCSDQFVATKGVKRTRSRRKISRRKKIKQEVTSSEEEEVDVETPCSVPLVVPKITIAITPSLTRMPAKRGRKPKNRIEGQYLKKPNNKNCPVTPKILQAAIKQQTKKCYITKSGRVTRISNSVETTPSTSTPSSISNSRCNSDNEDNVDKRASHNMAERNRRQELTNLFQNLRQRVPAIKKNLKASKVLILQSSVTHISELEETERQKMLLKEQLRAEMENKLALVQSLKYSRGCSS